MQINRNYNNKSEMEDNDSTIKQNVHEKHKDIIKTKQAANSLSPATEKEPIVHKPPKSISLPSPKIDSGSDTLQKQAKQSIKKAKDDSEPIIPKNKLGLKIPDSLQEFAKKQMRVNESVIARAAAQYPFIHEMAQQLGQTYEKLFEQEDISQNDLEKLRNQHQTLNELTLLVRSIGKNKDMKDGFQNNLWQVSCDVNFNPYASGEKSLSKEEAEEWLFSQIDKVQNPPPEEVLQNPRNQPIPPRQIARRAQLFSAERQAIQHASGAFRLDFITPSNKKSVNKVIFLNKPGTEEPVAVYKESQKGEQASGIMEELISDIADLTKKDDLFVPTKRARLRFKEHMVQTGKDKGVVWTEKPVTRGEKLTLEQRQARKKELSSGTMQKSVHSPRKGGIQPHRPHISQREWEATRGTSKFIPLNKEALNRLVFTHIEYGMGDLHGNNLMITDQGGFELFDNTRSFPHSNNSITKFDKLMIPFRFELLGSEECNIPLTEADKASFREQLEESKQNLVNLRVYLNLPQVKAKIEALPPGWFDTEKVLAAYEERLDNFENALNDPNSITIRELVTRSVPYARFMFALSLAAGKKEAEPSPNWIECKSEMEAIADLKSSDPTAYNKKVGKLVKTKLKDLGYWDFKTLLTVATAQGFPLEKLEALALDGSLTLDDIAEQVIALAKEPYTKSEKESLESINRMLEQISAAAALDNKDASASSSIRSSTNEYLEEFEKLFNAESISASIIDNTPTKEKVREDLEKVQPYKFIAYYDQKNQTMWVSWKDLNANSQILRLCYKPEKGVYILPDKDAPHLSNQPFIPKELIPQISPPYFYSVDHRGASDLLKDQPGKWILRHSTKNNNLVISCNIGGTIQHYLFAPMPKHPLETQKWIFGSETFSINLIEIFMRSKNLTALKRE